MCPKAEILLFDHVSFGYQEKEILHDISVTLRKGTLTALVGPSGSGKSTMLKLCARFYDPHKGSVRFNGMDMKELELESLMKHCSMVFQDVYLFQDTLKNNIRFGRTDATDEENEVEVQQAINTLIAGRTVIVIARCSVVLLTASKRFEMPTGLLCWKKDELRNKALMMNF